MSEDDLRAIAKRGYEGAVTTDLDQQAQAVGLFLSDALVQISAPRPLLKRSACSSATRLPASTSPAKRFCSARLRRHTGVAPQQLHRHMGRDAVTPRPENSAGPEAVPGAVRPERGLAPQPPLRTATSRTSPSRKVRFSSHRLISLEIFRPSPIRGGLMILTPPITHS